MGILIKLFGLGILKANESYKTQQAIKKLDAESGGVHSDQWYREHNTTPQKEHDKELKEMWKRKLENDRKEREEREKWTKEYVERMSNNDL
jgi:hypothetical protein